MTAERVLTRTLAGPVLATDPLYTIGPCATARYNRGLRSEPGFSWPGSHQRISERQHTRIPSRHPVVDSSGSWRPDLRLRTVSRRTAEYRAARRARARVASHRRSESAAPGRNIFRASTTTRACARRARSWLTRADRAGRDGRGGMAARQLHLVTSDSRHPPAPARTSTGSSPRSPRASRAATRGSTRWPSSWCATATAGSIGSSCRAHQQLPARRAADDRRLWAWQAC